MQTDAINRSLETSRNLGISQNRETSQNLDISIVVVSFNTRELLRECIQAIELEAKNIRHETIVVDNASKDGSADMIAAEFPAIRLIRSNENLGFAPANNLAFSIAQGRYVVLINSDAFPQPQALRRSIEHMDAHPEVGLGGGRLVGRDGSWQPSARMFPSMFNELTVMSGLAARHPKSRLWGRADRTWADPQQAAAVDWLPGAYVIIRRAVLEQVGYFDPRFFMYYEEVDLCRRIKAAGYNVWYWPDIVNVHLGGESAKTLTSLTQSASGCRLVAWRMRAQLLYYRKHHKALGAWSAALLETCWNRLRMWRNSLSASASRWARAEESRTMIKLMKQAWHDTRGGQISPPSPW